MKPSHLLGLALLLLPSAAFLWHNSDLPEFGGLHDDSIYFVSAKSLAQGHYRIESLPGEPAQTKYPPLYPALLSLAWRIQPQFPQNLRVAAWLNWLALPAMLAGLLLLFPRLGLDGWRKWLLLAALAANPYVVLFGSKLLSELWFTALLSAVLLLVERSLKDTAGKGWAAAAGIVAGLAYLTRTAGIVLLASAFLYLWLRKERVKAWLFEAGMLPFVAAWTLWSRLHQFHTTDTALVYYVDYIRYEFINVHLSNLHLVLWKNIDGLVFGLGSLMLPKVVDSLLAKVIAEVLAVAMIVGVVRMARKGQALHYVLFSAGSAVMLILWHFPPNERFVLPLAPLAFAGLLTEMEHFAGMVRAGFKHRDVSQRAASGIMAAAVASGFAACFALQAYVEGSLMEQVAQQQRERNVDLLGAYAWVRAHLPAGAALVSYNDPVMYLYTGRPAISRPLPPQLWYEEDHQGAVRLYRDLPAYAEAHGAEYVYFTTADMTRDMSQEDATAITEAVETNPDLEPVFKLGKGTIYRVMDSARDSAAARPSAQTH